MITENKAKISRGTVMVRGASFTSFKCSGRGPKKIRLTVQREYPTVRTVMIIATKAMMSWLVEPVRAPLNVPLKIKNLDIKPIVGGIPPIEKNPSKHKIAVRGIRSAKPPISLMLRVPTWAIRIPATPKRMHFPNPWVT